VGMKVLKKKKEEEANLTIKSLYVFYFILFCVGAS
jgi:hypothetical protein